MQILLVPYTGEWGGAEVWLDVATRSTYNLLKAAAKAGVKRVTMLTSMASFLAVSCVREQICTSTILIFECDIHIHNTCY